MGGARGRRWGAGAGIGVVLFAAYLLNGREIGANDTVPNRLLPVAVLRGDGLRLDRFAPLWPLFTGGEPGLPYFVSERNGAVVSRYPVAPGLLAVPLVLPQLLVLDAVNPGWERQPRTALALATAMAKNAAAAIAALVGVALFALLRELRVGSVAVPAVLITALGSNVATTASQSAWQHGPAALWLTLALLALAPPRASRGRLCVGGLACALLVCSRPQDALFAVALAGFVLVRRGREIAWFLPFPIALGALLVWHNVATFGTPLGGYAELLPIATAVHDAPRAWPISPWPGALGTLVSPSRGLLVYSPWVLVSLAALPATHARLAEWPAVRVALATLAPFYVQLALQAGWWAGWSFGPRYWTEVMPLFGVLLALALAWARERSRAWLAALAATGAIAVAIQVVGVCCYPCSWTAEPRDVNRDPGRLWDACDSELARCAGECPWGCPRIGTSRWLVRRLPGPARQ